VLEQAAGMDQINAFVRQKGETLFEIGNDIDILGRHPVDPDTPALGQRLTPVPAAKLNLDRPRPGKDLIEINPNLQVTYPFS
jgi:hypothetical protein